MLTTLDETFLHQSPLTFDRTSISDHRFFDRMWLGSSAPDNVRFITGMAAYKNTNTFDGYFAVYKNGRQYNLRLSRPLLPDPEATRVGPLRMEMIEPFKSLKIIVEPGGNHGFQAEINFTATTPLREELPHNRRVDGRLFQDYVRLDQIGKVDGWFSVEGERTIVDNWFSARDHSWGVRPGMGGYEPQTALPEANDNRGDIGAGLQGFFALYLFFETPSYCGYLQKHEDGSGRIFHEEGDITFKETRETVAVRTIEHDLRFIAGTRVCEGGALNLVLKNSDTIAIVVKPHMPPWCYKGTGYDSGYNDERGLGLHRGNLLEYDVYDVSHPENVTMPDGRIVRPWHRELATAVTVNGEPGLGHFPMITSGHIEKYLLTGDIINKRGE